MDVLKLRYLIREAIEDTIKQQSTFKIGNKVTTVDGDTAKVTMAEHPFYTVELESTGTTKSYQFQDLAPFVEKEVVNIPAETKHRVQNNGTKDLIFIETQTGTYFGEDDIVRLEDDYGRNNED